MEKKQITRIVKIALCALLGLAFYCLILGIMSVRYIVIDGRKYDTTAVSMKLLSDTDFRDDSNYSFLSKFKRLQTLDIRDLPLSEKGIQNITSSVNEGVTVIYNVPLGQKVYATDVKKLVITDEIVRETENLSDTLSRFHHLERFTAKDISSVDHLFEAVESVKANNPSVKCVYNTSYCGIDLNPSTEELILNNIPLSDTEGVRKVLTLFPHIHKVEMRDCGISDEEMGNLRKAFPDVQIDWMLHFLIYDVPTDVRVFSTLVGNWIAYADEKTFDPLFQYCTDLRALDLGHWDHISDISAIRNLKNLEILIISDNAIEDISPLADLQHMKYMDIRQNKIKDVSPLLALKELQFLEVGGNPLENAELLCGCESLKYLYIEGNTVIPDASVRALLNGLPEGCEFKMKQTRGHKWYIRIINMFRRWKKIKVYHDWENVEYYE